MIHTCVNMRSHILIQQVNSTYGRFRWSSVKIIEWVHLVESNRVNMTLFRNALAQQTAELEKAKIHFERFEVEPEDQKIWERDFEPALRGLFVAFEKSIAEAYLYADNTSKAQLKKVIQHMQEAERIEQYVQTRYQSIHYLTQKEVEKTLTLISEQASTLLSME